MKLHYMETIDINFTVTLECKCNVTTMYATYGDINWYYNVDLCTYNQYEKLAKIKHVDVENAIKAKGITFSGNKNDLITYGRLTDVALL